MNNIHFPISRFITDNGGETGMAAARKESSRTGTGVHFSTTSDKATESAPGAQQRRPHSKQQAEARSGFKAWVKAKQETQHVSVNLFFFLLFEYMLISENYSHYFIFETRGRSGKGRSVFC